MSTEIIAVPDSAAIPREPTMLDIIREVACNPSADVGKLERLLTIQQQQQTREAEAEFNAAMARVQSRLPAIKKTRKIEVKGVVRSHYAAYEDIFREIGPLLSSEGFSVSYTSRLQDKGLMVTVFISHRLGHQRAHEMFVPFDGSQFRSDAQSWGSTLQFGKRYALCAALNIVTIGEDNDAQGGKAPKPTYISQDQGDKIEDFIASLGMDATAVANMLKIMEAPSVRQLKAEHYRPVMNLLEAKRGRR